MKKLKTDTAFRLEFEIDMKIMKDWFEKTESTLALLSVDEDDDVDDDPFLTSQEEFSEEEQFVLIQVLLFFEILNSIILAVLSYYF